MKGDICRPLADLSAERGEAGCHRSGKRGSAGGKKGKKAKGEGTREREEVENLRWISATC